MSELLLDVQAAAPATPAAGQLYGFPLTGTKRWTSKDDAGRTLTIPPLTNHNTTDSVANAADTYLVGSRIDVPAHGLQVGTRFRWTLAMTKTAAGTAAPVWSVRVGTAGTTGDTARLTFTQVALQTAAIDTGWVEIVAIIRSVGAAGVMAGGLHMAHVLAATGFSTLDHNVMSAVSAGFDTTVANLFVGVSVNPGASGVWTHQIVTVEASGI